MTWIDITVWSICAVMAGGIGWSKYEKKKKRDQLLADLAAMEPERREKLLLRLNPKMQAEIRQELMIRYGLS